MQVAFKLVSAALSLVIVSSVSSHAQTPIAKQAIEKAAAVVGKIKNDCSADIKSFCPKVMLGDGRLALCMMAHEDQLSDQCFGALFDASEGIDLAMSNIRRAADVCAPEIDKNCRDVEPGKGRIAQCLIDNKAKLSSICRAEIAGIEARLKK